MKKQDDLYLSQIQERIRSIKAHLKGVSEAKFHKSSLHKSAIIRELEVIGEAARLVSDETKKNFPHIPWQQMIGMRNRLIHGYFSVDESIVWEVVTAQLPQLEREIEEVFLEVALPAHPWRACPIGYHFVKKHNRKFRATVSKASQKTSVRAHCRHNPSGKDQLYAEEILSISKVADHGSAPAAGSMKATNAQKYDAQIRVWTQYWNDIFRPNTPLTPNTVKALIFSESSFRENINDVRIRKNNYARGLLQVTDQTRAILKDEKGEVKDHYLDVSPNEIKIPDVALAVAVRWLFHKKELASKYLKREATWDESVAHYKAYLRLKKDFREQKGMKNYFYALDEMEGKKIEK